MVVNRKVQFTIKCGSYHNQTTAYKAKRKAFLVHLSLYFADVHTWYKKPYIVFGMGILLFILLSVTVLCSFLLPTSAGPTRAGATSDSNEQDNVLDPPNIGKNLYILLKLKYPSRYSNVCIIDLF